MIKSSSHMHGTQQLKKKTKCQENPVSNYYHRQLLIEIIRDERAKVQQNIQDHTVAYAV